MTDESRSHFYRHVSSLCEISRCPACHHSTLDGIGGALHCPCCRGVYPERNGFIDFEPLPDPPSLAQRVMESVGYPVFYQQLTRPLFTRTLLHSALEREYRRTLRLMALRPHHRALDVACGTGLFVRRFAAKLGADGLAIGLDRSHTALGQAYRLKVNSGLDSLTLMRADATHIPLNDDAFDRVHCAAALNFMSEPDKALAEMRRVLRPGGLLVLSTFAVLRKPSSKRLLGSMLRRSVGIQGFDQGEILEMVSRSGFHVDWQTVTPTGVTLRAVAARRRQPWRSAGGGHRRSPIPAPIGQNPLREDRREPPRSVL